MNCRCAYKRAVLRYIFACSVFLFIVNYTYYTSLLKDDTTSLDKIQKSLSAREEMLEKSLSELNAEINALERRQIKESQTSDNSVQLPPSPHRNIHVIPVLIIACNRPTVTRAIDSVLKAIPDSEAFPIYVSQDGTHQLTKSAILKYRDRINYIQHPTLPVPVNIKKNKMASNYWKISMHFKWAFEHLFETLNYDSLIVLEDDLEVSPDFFQYMSSTLSILKSDPSLFCVSAWNDNGKAKLINPEKLETLYRTDFFPGLGWMLLKNLWLELKPKWPSYYWDDWLRSDQQRRNRSCIRPEIPRSSTFGKVGVSNGQFFNQHLQYIKHNQIFTNFSNLDLSYLNKENYDAIFNKSVYSAPIVTVDKILKSVQLGTVSVVYDSVANYKKLAKQFGIMDDFKDGIPRTAYRGVVSFYIHGTQVHLRPSWKWKGYLKNWK